MDISQTYEKEFLALRYSLMTQSTDVRIKVEGFKLLLNLSKKLKWSYYHEELARQVKSDPNLLSYIGNTLIEGLIESPHSSSLDQMDNFFVKLQPKEIAGNSPRIREYANVYFQKGHFAQFNNIFSRYIKNMKDMNDYEMNEFIIKYFISSVFKKNYEIAISEIQALKHQYIQFDLNFYTFLLRFINGNYTEAAENVLNIQQNVFTQAWKLVTEGDLVFYFGLTLLIAYQRRIMTEIQTLGHSLIYKMLEDNIHYFELLENYGKCRFDWIMNEFGSICEKIQKDPLLVGNYPKINFAVKNNVLKEILKTTSQVSIEYLSKLLKEKENIIENWILSGISEGYLKVRIDDIEKIIYSKEINLIDRSVKKTIDFSKRTWNNSMIKLLNLAYPLQCEMRQLDSRDFKSFPIDRKYLNRDDY